MNADPPSLPDKAGKTARKSSPFDLVQHLCCLALPPLTFLALFASDNEIRPPQSVVIAVVAVALWAFVVSLFLFRRLLPRVRRSIPEALAALFLSSAVTAFLFPFPSSDADRSRATVRAGKGDFVVKTLGEADADANDPIVWPARGAFRTSDEAFRSLAAARFFEWVPVSHVFRKEPNADATNGCLWVLLAGAAECGPRTPVLWSPNLRGVRAEDFAGGPPEKPWGARFEKDGDPDLGRFVCIVRKDGSHDVVEGRSLTREAFLGGSAADPAALEVLEPGP